MVVNYMEILVDKEISELKKIENYFKCTCPDCLDNIKAIVLNNVKPYYITSAQGKVYAEYRNKEFQNQVDILAEITKAQKIVEANPKHGLTSEV